MIGRDQEIKQLKHHLHSALNGTGTTVFISGEAGVGKTRLVHEFLNLAEKRGIMIFSGWCLSEANVPYFPFKEALNTYMSTTSDEKVKSIVTKHMRVTGWLHITEPAQESQAREIFSTPEIERDRTFEAVARVILQLSAQKPLILCLEDLHWADRLSLALLHYLSRKSRNSRLLIIGTYRPEELVPTQAEQLHSLEETMFSMSLEDLLSKMELKRLRRTDFPKLLRSIFRSSLDETFQQKLYQETEGNPLFAIETLNMLVDQGYLVEREGRWVLTGQTESIGMPSKVHQVITRRISRLGREKRKLLDLAAVCGASFTAHTLSRVLTLDIADVLEVLVELEQRHRLIRSADSAFEFTHHKIGEVIYENMPSELRKIYHLKTANCLEQALTGKNFDHHMADIVLHYVEGGVPEKAFGNLVKLGKKAVDIFASVQAIGYLNKALETTQKNVSLATSENLAEIHRLRGLAWLQQDEPKKAISDLNSMLHHATNIGDESTIAEAHLLLGQSYANIEEFSPYFEKSDVVMRYFTTALEMARKTGNKPLEGRSLGSIGGMLIAKLDTMDEGCMRLEEASRICKDIGDKASEARILAKLGWYYNWKGEFNRAKENLNRALALDEEVGVVARTIDKLWFLSIVLAGNGEYNDAISAGQKCLQLARDYGNWNVASWVLNTLGWIYHDLSNIELASKYNNESIRIARTHQRGIALGGVAHALTNLGQDDLRKDDIENAEKNFEEANRSYHQHPISWWRLKTRIDLGLGEVALAKGDYMRALRLAEDSLTTSEKAGAKKYIAKSLKLKAEVFAKVDRIGEAIELMENSLRSALQVGNPPSIWQIHYSLGLILEKHGDAAKANERYARAVALIGAVAAKLNDAVLKSTFLTSPETRAIRDSYARTTSMPDSTEKAAGLDDSESVIIRARLSAPREFIPGEEFQVKLDLVNVGRKPGLLLRVEGLAPQKSEVLNVPPYYVLKDGSLDMKGQRINPLSTESIRIGVKVTGFVGVNLSPQVVYVDELGNFRSIQVEESKILPIVDFESEAARVIFNYLIEAFVDDFAKRRLTVEKSGWRSLPQMIRGTGVSKRSLYGTGGRLGSGLSELQRKDLIDLKTFRGERGRGGRILRARIHHEKELVRRYVKEKAPDLAM